MLDHSIYQSVFNSSPVGEYLLAPTPAATIFAVNETFLRTVSRKREELVGKGLFEAFPANPDDPQDTGVAALHRSLTRVIATGQPEVMPLQRYPITVQLPDGSKRYEERFWSASNTPIFDTAGSLVCISHRTVDVTDKKHAEDAAQQQAARQAFQLELADRIRPLTDPEEVTAVASELLGKHVGAKRVIYGELDESGECLAMNCDWTDGTLQSMAGMRLKLSDFGPLIVDVVRAGRVLAVDDVTTNEHSAPYADAYLANGVRAVLAIPLMKNGRLRASLNIHDSVVHHWTSNEIAMAIDMVDRTWSALESARAQAKLRIERDRSQSVFDGMAEGFALINHDWTVLQMNAEGLRIGQRAAPEVIGKTHWEAWPETVGTEVEKLYRRVMKTRVPGILEYYQTFTNRHTAWIEVRAYPTGHDELAVLFRDITERRATEEKLRDADRRKDEFLAMLAHELRNPLAPIGSAARLLQMAKLDDARVRQTSQIIGRQVDHMTHLINDLLDVSRVTRGLVELDNAALDIRHVLTDAVEQVTPLMQSRRHHLALHLPPDTTMVMGDEKRLVQVITNILNNAAKYTNEGGHILLKTEVREAHVQIEVVDNGIGMAPQLAAHAFDLFAQAERTSDRSAGGLGLGLALVKSLVELHGGKVTCESEGLAKGSKFTVCLPRLTAQQYRDDDQQDAGSALHTDTKPLRVMVVDDNVDAASMLAMLLEALGHQVMVEHGSRRALQRAGAEAPEVCLLDIGLPEMDGNELAQHLRAQPGTAKSVLIAITGYGQDNDRKRTLSAGFDHHLVKPVDTQTLIAILAEISRV